MRLLHPSLGLTALVAAFAIGAIGVRTEEGIFGMATSQDAADARSHPPTPSDRGPAPSSRLPKQKEIHPDPRLEELTRNLSLSHTQQDEIHPAIVRASFGYDPEKPYPLLPGDPPRFLGPPLTRADFEDLLFAILDVEQQLDYAATVTEKEAWWQSVISRLEADLEDETSPSAQLPSPPPVQPEPEVRPSLSRDRRLQLPPATD